VIAVPAMCAGSAQLQAQVAPARDNTHGSLVDGRSFNSYIMNDLLASGKAKEGPDGGPIRPLCAERNAEAGVAEVAAS